MVQTLASQMLSCISWAFEDHAVRLVTMKQELCISFVNRISKNNRIRGKRSNHYKAIYRSLGQRSPSPCQKYAESVSVCDTLVVDRKRENPIALHTVSCILYVE